jgi:hypothetical protein
MSEYKFMQFHEQHTGRAIWLLNKASAFRWESKPEQWARNLERKALKALENSWQSRTLFGFDLPSEVSRRIKW